MSGDTLRDSNEIITIDPGVRGRSIYIEYFCKRLEHYSNEPETIKFLAKELKIWWYESKKHKKFLKKLKKKKHGRRKN
jgi:hypothetical protein